MKMLMHVYDIIKKRLRIINIEYKICVLIILKKKVYIYYLKLYIYTIVYNNEIKMFTITAYVEIKTINKYILLVEVGQVKK